ncbi:MAG: Rrf2 family transcriptional regulator [candidate division Zixibacteria bacterium]|nr:Rrf2 family transcriptional regulator [candidate division Zixibacteria bacterium]
MKVSALEEYGLRCMVYLAKRKPRGAAALTEISENEGITIAYAGKLLMILRQSGLVKAIRGRNGGYVLTNPPEETTLKDIFEALGEPFGSPSHCVRYETEDGSCVHTDDCSIKGMWKAFGFVIDNITRNLTLADLVNNNIAIDNIFSGADLSNEVFGNQQDGGKAEIESNNLIYKGK